MYPWNLASAQVASLRGYQQELVDDVRAAYVGGHRRVVAVMPTGAGKGQTIAAVVRSAVGRGSRVLVLAHRRRLINQLRRTIEQWGVGGEVTVESVQTVIRRLGAMEPPDLIVIDEAHHLVEGNIWGKIIEAWPGAFLLGKTATPERLDGRGLGEGRGGYFQAIVEGPTTRWLTDQGYLARARVFCPPNQLDRDRLRIVRGDYVIRDVEEQLISGGIYGDAVEQYMKHVYPGTMLVACVSVQHARMVAEQYQAAGVAAAVITQGCSEAEQEALFQALASGAVKVVTYCEMLSEGVDVPSVKATQLLRPTASLVMYLQQVGRVLRVKPDGSEAIVLDHVGNVQRHGLPTDEREWTLEGRRKRANDALAVKVCPVCFVALPSQASLCDSCGHQFISEAKSPEKEQIDCDLVEVTERQLEAGAEIDVWFGRHWKPGFALAEWPAEGAATVQRASGGNTWRVKREHVRLTGSGGKYEYPFQIGDVVRDMRDQHEYRVIGRAQGGSLLVIEATDTECMEASRLDWADAELLFRPKGQKGWNELASAQARRREQAQAQSLKDLIQVGRQRGMKNPWAWAQHVLAARQAKAVA